MTITCPICKAVQMPVYKSACSRECVKKQLMSSLYPERSEAAKRSRKIQLMTDRAR